MENCKVTVCVTIKYESSFFIVRQSCHYETVKNVFQVACFLIQNRHNAIIINTIMPNLVRNNKDGEPQTEQQVGKVFSENKNRFKIIVSMSSWV